MIHGILFDLDGVLVDSKRVWYATLNAVRHDFGLPDVTDREFDDAWGQSVADDARGFFHDRIGVSDLNERYGREFPMHLDRVERIEPDADVTLRTLREAGTALAVTTNAPRTTAHAMLEGAGLSAVFDALVATDDVEAAKPAPDMVVEAARRLGVRLEEAVLVGDTAVDLRAGRNAGITVVGFRMAGADHRIDRLAELIDLLPSL